MADQNIFPVGSKVSFRHPKTSIPTSGKVISGDENSYQVDWMGEIFEIPNDPNRIWGHKPAGDYYLRQAQESNRLEHEARAYRESREDW